MESNLTENSESTSDEPGRLDLPAEPESDRDPGGPPTIDEPVTDADRPQAVLQTQPLTPTPSGNRLAPILPGPAQMGGVAAMHQAVMNHVLSMHAAVLHDLCRAWAKNHHA